MGPTDKRHVLRCQLNPLTNDPSLFIPLRCYAALLRHHGRAQQAEDGVPPGANGGGGQEGQADQWVGDPAKGQGDEMPQRGWSLNWGTKQGVSANTAG